MAINGNNNGNVKWKTAAALFVSLLGTIAAIMIWGVNQVSAVEQRSITRDRELNTCIHSYIIPMSNDIAAIKMRLGIRK